ncbi:MAG: molybdopterin-dependent oxidoreductase [Candidatus Bipolaricaulia bacterium]
MRRRVQRGTAITVVVLSMVAFVCAIADDSPVQEIEIDEYQGERLGSVEDFPENSILGVQHVAAATYALRIDGIVSQTASLTLQELQAFSREEKLVTLNCVEGWSVKALWEGIPLAELLETVQPSPEANTVIFHAADGYTSSLPLEFILERNLIIADRINGITLPASRGFPFQLIAEEKFGYKWVRWLTRIELSDDPNYRGFWERRGFNNDAALDGPILDDG